MIPGIAPAIAKKKADDDHWSFEVTPGPILAGPPGGEFILDGGVVQKGFWSPINLPPVRSSRILGAPGYSAGEEWNTMSLGFYDPIDETKLIGKSVWVDGVAYSSLVGWHKLFDYQYKYDADGDFPFVADQTFLVEIR